MRFQLRRRSRRHCVTPVTHQVPIKFTAGLHHPLRMFRDEVQTKMHGFLNVLGAAVLAAEYKWDSRQTAPMLEDENANSLSFTDEFFAWREWKFDVRTSARQTRICHFVRQL